MKINYDTIDRAHILARPFTAGASHIALGLTSRLDLDVVQRVGHLALGILELIPLMNILIWAIDRKLSGISQMKPLEVFEAEGDTPHEIGRSHGKKYRREIKRLYTEYALPMVRRFEKKHKRDCAEIGMRIVDRMDPSIKAELQGLAEGAKVPYEDVVMVNTFLSVFPEETACSAVALKRGGGLATEAVAIDNNGTTTGDAKSMSAYGKRTNNIVGSLQQSNYRATMQSVIFDPHQGTFSVSRSGDGAATGEFHSVDIPGLGPANPEERDIIVGRNLDWGGGAIAHDAIVLVRNNVFSVTFPGLITGMTAINTHGVHASYLTNNRAKAPIENGGVDAPLQMYQMLKQVRSADEMRSVVEASRFHGAFHMMIGDKTCAHALQHNPGKRPEESQTIVTSCV